MKKQDFVDRIAKDRTMAARAPTTQNLHRLASSLSSLGKYVASKENNYFEAISFYEEAKSICHLIGDNEGKAKAYFDLCKIYELGLHDNEKAYLYIEKALEFVQDRILGEYYEYEYECLKVSGIKEGWL